MEDLDTIIKHIAKSKIDTPVSELKVNLDEDDTDLDDKPNEIDREE